MSNVEYQRLAEYAELLARLCKTRQHMSGMMRAQISAYIWEYVEGLAEGISVDEVRARHDAQWREKGERASRRNARAADAARTPAAGRVRKLRAKPRHTTVVLLQREQWNMLGPWTTWLLLTARRDGSFTLKVRTSDSESSTNFHCSKPFRTGESFLAALEDANGIEEWELGAEVVTDLLPRVAELSPALADSIAVALLLSGEADDEEAEADDEE